MTPKFAISKRLCDSNDNNIERNLNNGQLLLALQIYVHHESSQTWLFLSRYHSKEQDLGKKRMLSAVDHGVGSTLTLKRERSILVIAKTQSLLLLEPVDTRACCYHSKPSSPFEAVVGPFEACRGVEHFIGPQ